jgi:hypothetical protein
MLVVYGILARRDAGAGAETELGSHTLGENCRTSAFWRPERPESVKVWMYDSKLGNALPLVPEQRTNLSFMINELVRSPKRIYNTSPECCVRSYRYTSWAATPPSSSDGHYNEH